MLAVQRGWWGCTGCWLSVVFIPLWNRQSIKELLQRAALIHSRISGAFSRLFIMIFFLSLSFFPACPWQHRHEHTIRRPSWLSGQWCPYNQLFALHSCPLFSSFLTSGSEIRKVWHVIEAMPKASSPYFFCGDCHCCWLVVNFSLWKFYGHQTLCEL